MSGEICVNPPALRQLAASLDGVIQELAAAQAAIVDSSSAGGASFSPAGEPMGWMFSAAIEFAGTDAFEQADQIASIQERLHTSATTWETTEEHSTVTEC